MVHEDNVNVLHPYSLMDEINTKGLVEVTMEFWWDSWIGRIIRIVSVRNPLKVRIFARCTQVKAEVAIGAQYRWFNEVEQRVRDVISTYTHMINSDTELVRYNYILWISLMSVSWH